MRSLLVCIFCLVALVSDAQVFTEFPRHLQFYPRDAEDSAVVPISGMTIIPGYDTFYVEVLRNGVFARRYAQPAVYDGSSASFSLRPKIYAELADYSFRLYAKANLIANDLLASRDSIVAGDVYLIAGQSNAVLSRGDVTWRNKYCRTFGLYNSQSAGDTNWALSAADTNLLNPAVGVWALNLQKKIVDAYKIPTCFINGAVGGKAIELMQRNDDTPTKLTTIYGMMLYRVQKSGLADHAKAMFWYQGESNNGGSYLYNFTTLRNSWKTDYPNLEKIYVFQIRPGCNVTREHAQLREVQRTLPKTFPDVRTISTVGIPYHDGCHFTTQGYEIVAERVFNAVARDFYGSVDTVSIDGPNIARAFFTTMSRTEIALVFSPLGSQLSITPDIANDSVHASMKEYFFLDGSQAQVLSLMPKVDTLFITLTAPSFASKLTYLPDKYYLGTSIFYEGPWIVNERGVGAFSFWNFPLEAPASVAFRSESEEQFAVYPNPAITEAAFNITLTADDDISIELHDLLGRKITTIMESRLAAGSYKIPFVIEPTFSRVMIAHLRSSQGVKSLQFVTAR